MSDKSKVDIEGLKESMSKIEPEALKKRGRGRPRKEPDPIPPVEPETVVIQITPAMVRPVINGITKALETRLGVEFRYDEKSKETIAGALVPVLQKHSSRLFAKYGEELVLIFIVLGDTYPRLAARNDRLIVEGKRPLTKSKPKVPAEKSSRK